MDEQRILVVDDEPIVREILTRYLTREGYGVDEARDGQEALDACASTPPDLVLLDLMLPKLDGLEVFRRLRGPNAPAVIMLTARSEEADRLVGLELGADDYIVKPFSPREVVARVRAVLRRSTGPSDRSLPDDAVLEFDGLRIDGERREVLVHGKPVRLTRKEFDLLHLMAQQPDVVFSRARLLEEVWDFAWHGDASTVTVHVRRVREKIEDDPSHPKRLVTVWGVGYRFDP